jgi:hypothetical protein
MMSVANNNEKRACRVMSADEARFVSGMIYGLNQESAEQAALGFPPPQRRDFADLLGKAIRLSNEARHAEQRH